MRKTVKETKGRLWRGFTFLDTTFCQTDLQETLLMDAEEESVCGHGTWTETIVVLSSKKTSISSAPSSAFMPPFSSFDDIRIILAVIGTFLSICSSCCCLLLSSLASSVLRRCGKHRVLSFPLSPAQVATAADDLPLDNFVCDEHSDSECGLMPPKLATCETPPFGSPLLRWVAPPSLPKTKSPQTTTIQGPIKAQRQVTQSLTSLPMLSRRPLSSSRLHVWLDLI